MTRLPVLLCSVVIGGCSAFRVDPCSPRSTAVVDALCAEAVVQVMAESCPDAETVSECPAGMAALVGCDQAVELHASECSR